MTEQERHPTAAGGTEGQADDIDDTLEPRELGSDEGSDEADDDVDETDDGDEGEDLDEGDLEPEPRAVASAAAMAPGGRRGRDRQQPKNAPVLPSVSEQAVHIGDRASAVFVIGVVGVFVAILLYGLLLGGNGFVTGLLATPTPIVTAAPVATDSPAVSQSAAPSASGSDAPSAAPSAAASPSVAPSAASPSSAASAGPSAS
jgi:hypothetical protein